MNGSACCCDERCLREKQEEPRDRYNGVRRYSPAALPIAATSASTAIILSYSSPLTPSPSAEHGG
jgi:hypothetical protein